MSIVDLDQRSHQPMGTDCGRFFVSFNGEIFNHRALRRRLEQAGVCFRTQSDSETLLWSYAVFGPSFVELLDGQFAFCLYDATKNWLVLSRDRMGIVPLYYSIRGTKVYVSSDFRSLFHELRGFGDIVDSRALSQFLLLRFCLPPRTLIRNIFQVEPAQQIIVARGQMSCRYYWCLSGIQHDSNDSDASAQLCASLEQAVEKNLMTDVPFCIFLSGGLDSSVVAYLASRKSREPINTISIAFGGSPYDEDQYAGKVSRLLGTDHHVCRLEGDDAFAGLREALEAVDHPTAARDLFGMFHLARFARHIKPAVRVVLTGTGADELFNGYQNTYFMPHPDGGFEQNGPKYVEKYGFLEADSNRTLATALETQVDLDAVVSDVCSAVHRVCPKISNYDCFNVLNLFYLALHLVGWELAVNDSMCMSQSLEPRVPFLDHHFVEKAMTLPGRLKCRQGVDKFLLRTAFANHLPADIIARKKLPFSKPVAAWLCEHCLPTLLDVISLRPRGIFRKGAIENIAESADFDLLWRIVSLEYWLQAQYDKPPQEMAFDMSVTKSHQAPHSALPVRFAVMRTVGSGR